MITLPYAGERAVCHHGYRIGRSIACFTRNSLLNLGREWSNSGEAARWIGISNSYAILVKNESIAPTPISSLVGTDDVPDEINIQCRAYETQVGRRGCGCRENWGKDIDKRFLRFGIVVN